MSAPASAPAPAKPPARLVVLRLACIAAFVALGFVAVWQGFGLAGYGTDAHAHRVLWVCIPLLGSGLVLVCVKGWFPVRVLVALAFFGSACWAWWDVRSSNYKSAVSLRAAVAERDRYRELLATATLEDVERSEGMRGVTALTDQYPTLTAELAQEYTRWKAKTADDIVSRYDRTPPDDFKTIAELRGAGKALAAVHPPDPERLEAAFRGWLVRATHAKTDECRNIPLGDWAAFDRTAPGRGVFAEAFPMMRPALVAAEIEWVDASTERIVSMNLTPKAGENPPTRELWLRTQRDVLALKSLDASERRFAKARLRLFTVAHRAAQSEVYRHLDAARYDIAYSVARKHAVDWNATATVLGPEELKKLDALRETCAFFDKFASKAAAPPEAVDVAPPPRTKP
jgi:hypothetical protein